MGRNATTERYKHFFDKHTFLMCQVAFQIANGSFVYMADLRKTLGTYVPNNNGGSTATRGFSYQDNWAIEKLFSLQKSGQDYVLLFEVFDDISVLNSETDPTELNLYQVKTKKDGSPYTPAALCKKNKNGSHLGKLVLSREALSQELKDVVTGITLVSNCSFNVDAKNGQEFKVISVSELSKEHNEYICKKVHEETGVKMEGDLCEITFLLKSDLSFGDAEAHVKGMIADFVEEHLHGVTIKIAPLYEMLAAEIKKKSNNPLTASGFSDLIQEKGISKSWLNRQLSKLEGDIGEQGKLVLAALVGDWDVADIEALRKKWRDLELKVLTDLEFNESEGVLLIEKFLKKIPEGTNFGDKIDSVFQEEEVRSHYSDEDNYYIKAIIAWRTLNLTKEITEN
jgi:hypothetical protein